MNSPLGYQNLFEIDINPGGTANYVRVGSGLESASPSLNEDLVQKAYLDSDGGKTSHVTGFQLIYAFSGERDPFDAAQNYIMSKMLAMGASRNTNFRVTMADGTVLSGGCTIANIQPPGGNANDPQACGFDIHFNGKPSKTDPATATLLTQVIAVGSASGTTKATVTPGAGNKLGYKLTTAALTAKGRAYVEDFVPYTSGADIAAAVGQYLNMYELDAYNHVVKFVSYLLASGDIKA